MVGSRNDDGSNGNRSLHRRRRTARQRLALDSQREIRPSQGTARRRGDSPQHSCERTRTAPGIKAAGAALALIEASCFASAALAQTGTSSAGMNRHHHRHPLRAVGVPRPRADAPAAVSTADSRRPAGPAHAGVSPGRAEAPAQRVRGRSRAGAAPAGRREQRSTAGHPAHAGSCCARPSGLNLRPQRIDLGKETGFGFGPRRYPLCRVNAVKSIAFHGRRGARALIIRASGDHAFRLATGMLRRLSLSAALDA